MIQGSPSGFEGTEKRSKKLKKLPSRKSVVTVFMKDVQLAISI